jgi:hypothetical protein
MSDATPPRMPPRFVPVLTEVVQADEMALASAPAEPESGLNLVRPTGASATRSSDIEAIEDELIHCVMQRVDVSLEQHLPDAVADMVLQHTHALVPRLREEIEFVVRQAVAEAVAAELAQRAFK